MTPEEQTQIEAMQKEYELALAQSQSQPMPYASAAMFGTSNKHNLVEWELDFRPELADIEHLLRCDILSRDKDGNEIWERNPDPNMVVFNNQGVNDIMRIVRMFLNKNTVLSYYREEDIRVRVTIFAHLIRALIYNNYEAYGMDNPYKMNNYKMMTMTIVAMIESAYRRALNGEGHKGLADARVVQQSENINRESPHINVYGAPPQKKGILSRLAPWNWSKS